MPYVTNPHLIPHHSAAVTRQIIETMETGWSQTQTLDRCFKHTTAATTVQLCTRSGLQTAEGEGHLLLSVLEYNSTAFLTTKQTS